MVKRFLAAAAALSLLFVSATSRADAMQDLRDLRAGKTPLRADWLGWDGSTAIFRTLTCSDGGTESCGAAVVHAGPEGQRSSSTKLLEVVEMYCGNGGGCAPLDNGVGWSFVVAEKRALAALPPLDATPAAPDSATVFGQVSGSPTRLEIRAIPTGTAEDPSIAANLVLVGKGDAVETLATVDGRAQRLNPSHVLALYPSRDGARVAIVTEVHDGMMCWDFDGISIDNVSVPRHKASLANTIGFRAWKQHKTADASAAFVEATQLDPGFSLGWYNRAAMESAANEIADASASFDRARALQASLSKRACTDPDFANLRAASPDRFSCP